MILPPTRPYLIRAFYEWMIDNELTPYLQVNAELPGVNVPQNYVQDGQIVLNIASRAVEGIILDNDAISFNARFSGQSMHVFCPMAAIVAIYAKENLQGMGFDPEEYPEAAEHQAAVDAFASSDDSEHKQFEESPSLLSKRPTLTVVK